MQNERRVKRREVLVPINNNKNTFITINARLSIRTIALSISIGSDHTVSLATRNRPIAWALHCGTGSSEPPLVANAPEICDYGIIILPERLM